MPCTRPVLVSTVVLAHVVVASAAIAADGDDHPLGVWVKRHPVVRASAGAAAKPSPRLGYEGSYGYDPRAGLLMRYGGHNQGGGGEQNSEVWSYDLDRDVWRLRTPDTAPPGVCCAQQNVFDPALGRLLRFPAFSASHGWQSRREVWLADSSVWTFDPTSDRWRDRRPLPSPAVRPLRGAAYDSHHGVVVIHGGEGASHGTLVYEPHANRWHEIGARESERDTPSRGISQPGFTYDAVNRVFVLFGSQFDDDPRTWIFDLRTDTWRVLDVESSPPAEKTSPVLAADTRRGIVLAVLHAGEALETWTLDVAKRAWKRLAVPTEPDPSGARNRVLLYLPDRDIFVLENRTKDEQQIWTLRLPSSFDVASHLPAPASPRVVVDANGAVVVEWDAVTAASAGGSRFRYEVERGRGELAWRADFTSVARGLDVNRWIDPAPASSGEIVHYRVRSVALDGARSDPSPPASTRPAIVEDIVVSVLSANEIRVAWTESTFVAGARYRVERADAVVRSTDELVALRARYSRTGDLAVGRIERIGRFRSVSTVPLAVPEFIDREARLDDASGEQAALDLAEPVFERPARADDLVADGKPYRFRVRAYRVVVVDSRGVESGPSPPRFTFPSAVRGVRARDAGERATDLRWQQSREAALRGYLVWRHDGRWDKDTISLRTVEPLGALEFSDAEAGTSTRRYEVVAVDLLGQEGAPSSPVWSRREWARFYAPYAGEWHD